MPKRPARPAVGDLFSPTGPLASAKPGYRERPQQVDLAREVAKTFRNKGVLLADAPTGTGKCLHGSTLVTLSDGSRRRIKDLVGLKPEIVQLGQDWRMGTGRVAACYESGVKNMFRLRTRLGHELTASADHPLLTITGWSRIRDVRLGMRIAAARKLEGLSSDEELTNSELAFLGLMISDGGCSVLDAAYFINTDPDIVDDLYFAARGVGNLVVKPQKRGNTYRIVRGPRQGMGRHVRNDAVVLLEKHGVLGRTALTKTIPEAIFSLSAGRLALFLGRLWSGDGCIEVARRVASYSSASETLIRQVQHLLLRLGVVARARRHDGVCNGVRFPAWHLSVTEADNLRQFAETVGPHLVGPKATRLATAISALPREGNPNCDLIPSNAWTLIDKSRCRLGVSWYRLVKETGVSDDRRRGISRRKLERIADLLQDEELTRLARSDVYWDEVVSIEPVGRAMTYDISMVCEKPPNFFANDLVVHNSLAYLAPALLSGEKVVVSTATLALQNQLLVDDLPPLKKAVCDLLGYPEDEGFSYAVMKGRSNFLCGLRHEDTLRQGSIFDDNLLTGLDRWVVETESGDREDLPFPVPVGTWREIASDGEDCAPKACRFRDGCFYYAHRDRAAEADLLIVNHALLLANVAADGNIFDAEDRHLVIDEAHRLEDVMADALGARVSFGRVRYVARQASKKSDGASGYAEQAETAAEAFFGELQEGSKLGNERHAPPSYETLLDALGSVKRALAADPKEEANNLTGMVGRLGRDLKSFYADPEETHVYAIAQGRSRDASRRAHPELKSWLVDTAEAFREWVLPTFEGGGVVLASATLANGSGEGRTFSYTRHRLGLEESPGGRRVTEHAGEEVFDYVERCLLYVEERIGEPSLGTTDDYVEACVRRAEELVGISRGRALILLSTSRAVSAFRESFESPYPVRFQGDDAPGRLVRWLKETEGAVLVGTRTFWEGVDVPGESVSLVVIDRAPFPPPSDPVVARLCERAGKGWFREVSLPKAQVALRQGAGRLMRRPDDRGVIALLDPRIRARGWGKSVLKALPPAPITGSIEDVRRFFAADGG